MTYYLSDLIFPVRRPAISQPDELVKVVSWHEGLTCTPGEAFEVNSLGMVSKGL